MALARSPLQVVALLCHAALLLGVSGMAWNAGGAARWFTLGAGVLPLLLTLPALVRGRPAGAQWLALLLVIYAGAAAVEVVASLGTASFASLTLLAALVELGVLLAIIRRS